MKEIILDLSALVTILGITGLPFFSFTAIGIMMIKESLEDLDYYGIDGFLNDGWLNRHNRLLGALGFGIFPICTLVTLVRILVKLFGS